MALIKGEKVYRNLQEQVYENTCDIQELLRMYGYHGPYTSTDVIPNDDLYNRAMYLIGTGMPYKVYQYSDLTKRFTYIGDYNMDVGPEGPPGPQGPQGERGDTGLVDSFAKDAASITEVGQAYVDENGYLQVCTSLNPLTFEQGGYIKGPQGEQGPAGKDGIASITVNGSTYEPVDGNITIPDYPTSLEWDNIENKPTIPTKTSELTNDSNFITSSALNGLATETYVNNAITDVNNALNTEVTTRTTQINGVVTAISSLNDAIVAEQQTRSEEIARVEGNIPDISGLATKEEVTAVANDLSNHTSNDTIHVTASDKETWTNKVSQEQIADMATKTDLTNYVDLSTTQTVGGAKTFTAAPVVPNIKAQGTNESTVYGSTQMVHTFDDNTKLNLKYPSKTGNKTIATVDDLSNMVTTDTEQTITGRKTFNDVTNFNDPILVYGPETPGMVEGSAIGVSSTGLTRWDLYEGALSGTGFTLTAPRKEGTLAITSDIPDVSNFVTKSEIPEPDNIVTTNTEQTINADKTIKGTFRIARPDSSTALCLYNNQADNIAFAGFKYVNRKSVGTLYNLPLYDTETSKTIATTDQIPDVSNMATTDTEQTISAKKTFTNELRSESYIHIQDNSDNSYVQLYADRIERRDNQGQLRTNHLPGGDGQLATLNNIPTYYKHHITLGRTDDPKYIVQLELITTSSTKMTYAMVVAWMIKNAPGDTTAVGCTGMRFDTTGLVKQVAVSAYKYSGGDYVRVQWYNPQTAETTVMNATKLISSSVHPIK